MISHYEWLHKNFEQFCKTSGYRYFPGAITSHGDKLSNLQYLCEKRELPFYKVAAIGLIVFMFHRDIPYPECDDYAIQLYKEHPEWYNGCGGVEDAQTGY